MMPRAPFELNPLHFCFCLCYSRAHSFVPWRSQGMVVPWLLKFLHFPLDVLFPSAKIDHMKQRQPVTAGKVEGFIMTKIFILDDVAQAEFMADLFAGNPVNIRNTINAAREHNFMTGEHTEVIDQRRVVIAVFRATEVPQYDINPWGLKIIQMGYETVETASNQGTDKMKKFSELQIDQKFTCNGNICIKQSKRTAFVEYANRWFYFGADEVCEVV
jgi:hypothetical protein